ncbi:ethanolamine ammonia-lyase subunit EutC [Candidatus Methylospira mobilis]|uniref:Ethanolamine ammonia-lyase small subunit n=1 Tax=Candidatus Methylospira mobilis TaxID=1808979 RepID=A0A5Q0BKX5_9GAMM|nr:ethanolamine ammonia-lyase subunit EutC [Candidatus Methylospira mobilis]QFY44239.1 ethanolamine ammonia-lyase subunit EutC [Candidatus Methylospira mobilis]WNV06332.1 ethanolamine ammonia-lyase subunit EutC [Candidatus Methylospira mobilis]
MNDPWHKLRQFTQARIAQGRSGHAQTTAAQLDFQLAHAAARDAVHLPWDIKAFAREAATLGVNTLTLETQVIDRAQYLKRPDLGRILAPAARERLLAQACATTDIALTFSNGLSSTAMDAHGLMLLQTITTAFLKRGYALAPVFLVENARVALSDEIGALLNAKLSIIVVGERPGLSAADSLGIYMTYNPNPANTDAERNCISNVRQPEGLSCRNAATKLLYLGEQAFQRRLSGVALKDDMPGEWALEKGLATMISNQ